jgi:signal transduction histidine kinase/CheY-like chemotaxis protein
MPIMDGYELVRKLREAPDLKKIPVIFYSATFRSAEAHLLAESCGVSYVLTKPCKPKLILTTVDQALGGTNESFIDERIEKLPSDLIFKAPHELNTINEGFTNYLSDVEGLKARLTLSVSKAAGLAQEYEQLTAMTEKFSQSIDKSTRISSRLITFVELNLALILEHDHEKLLKLFCEGASRIMEAKYVCLGILNHENTKLKYFLSAGVSAELVNSSSPSDTIPIDNGFVKDILNARDIIKIDNIETEQIELGISTPIKSLLAAPVRTINRVYGFLYFGDKLDDQPFDEIDIQIASALVSEIAIFYENIEQYNLIQHHAAQLQITVAERNKVQEQLISSNKELEQFAFVASHDLKAPLRSIESLITWIEADKVTKLSEESKINFSLLVSRAKRMSYLIDGILQYSRIGRTNLEISTVSIKELIDEIVEMLDPSKKFTVQYDEKISELYLSTLKIILSQVFTNLIGNAIKYHDKSKGHIKIGVKDKDTDYYEFYVSDDGPGIEPIYHEKIFEIFQTLQSRDEIESAGIGLSIVKKIVEAQGGKVTVESDLGKGSTFRFTWPKHPLKI